MKSRDKQAIFEMKIDELKKQLSQTRGELETLLVSRGSKTLKNSRLPGILRKKIALLLTVLREKELHHG